MSKYSIIASNARMSALTENNLGKELLQISGTINTISKALAIHDCSQAMLQAALSGVVKELESNSDTMKQLGKALTDIANIYERTDKHISNSMTTANSGGILDWLSKNHSSAGTMYSGSLLGGAIGYDLLDGKVKYSPGSVSLDFALAKGSISGKSEYAKGSLEATLGKLSASGKIKASIFEDGKLRPGLLAQAKAGGSVLYGEANGQLGTDKYNIHTKAKGDLLTGEASASAGVGVIEKEDSNGNKSTTVGLKAKAGAEAYLAKGEVSGGFTIGGVKIDVSVGAKAGGAGAKAGGELTAGGASVDLGAGLGLGGELGVAVDWSDLFN